MPADVFISYRRGPGSSNVVRHLAAALRSRLGEDAVHLDVLTPPAGEVLSKRIQNDVKGASVMVLAIHPEWLQAIARLHNTDDWVRLEIEAALEFGIPILPVLLSGASMPRANDLPEELSIIAELPAATISENELFDTGVDDLYRGIRSRLPSKALRMLTHVANSNHINVALALMILGALMLFTSWILQIHTLHWNSTSVLFRIGSAQDRDTPINVFREVGTLMAWNWSVALILITPSMFILFSNTLSHAMELLRSLQYRKMIVYVGRTGGFTPISARSLWESVARPSSIWCQAFAAIAIVLGTYNWWTYSGQWYFAKTYSEANFLRASTGPDWNIAWHIISGLGDQGLVITLFALGMYLVYGISSLLTYSYYAFLFNLFAELSQLAASAGTRSSIALRLDVNDRSSGGLGSFRTIQRNHAMFCFWSLFAMYLMALRNAYLPLVCRIPDGVKDGVDAHRIATDQCSTMAGFALSILRNSADFATSLLEAKPRWATLFHAYSEQNHYVMGSMLYILLIASFFFLISSRMKSIVENARHDANPVIAQELLNRMRFENARVLIIMSAGALSAVFLNVGPFVILVALFLFPIEDLVAKLMRRAPALVSS